MKSLLCIVDLGVAMGRTTKSQTQGNGKALPLCGCWQCVHNLRVVVSFSWWLLSETFPYRDLLWRPPPEQAQPTWSQLFCTCVCCFFIPESPWSGLQDQAMHHLAAPFLGVLDSKITQIWLSDFKSWARKAILDGSLTNMNLSLLQVCACSQLLCARKKKCTPASEFYS